MKPDIFLVTGLALIFLLFIGSASSQSVKTGGAVLRHAVTVTFKPGAPAEQIALADHSFKNLAKS